MIKNIIFDLGGVLINYLPDRYIKTLGFDEKTEKTVYQVVCEDSIWNEVDTGKYIHFSDALEAMIHRHPALEKELRIFFRDGWMQNYFFLDEGIELFNQLYEEGYQLYILSNFSQEGFRYLLNHYDFFEKTEGCVVSSFIQMVKPEEKIYRYLLDQYHLDPRETAFIDDSKVNIEAAKRLGILGIRYSGKDSVLPVLEEANHGNH